MEDYDILEPEDIYDYQTTKLSNIQNECNPRSYEWVLFPKEIAANQLKQAGGTCYLVSSIEALSHVPNIIEYIFPDWLFFSSDNSSFKVTFYGMNEKGKSSTYIIYNKFPIDNKSDLKFMKPLENEAFAIILEKAWAAIVGGYKKINGGRSYEVLNKLFGTSCGRMYNSKMEILTIKYRNQEKKEIEFISKLSPKDKYDPVIIIDKIKNAFKKTCPIITAAINIGDGGHAYSILGTYSVKNPNNSDELQEFIILKNPWRSGSNDKEKEKMNEKEINEIVNNFKDIKEINDKYNTTGVFYMPMEYFKKWFRDVTICLPNYKKYFPKVYNSQNLYDAINSFYGYNSNQNYFDIVQGDSLIKVNIISKQNFQETYKKIIQYNNSEFAYVYDHYSLSSIWRYRNKIGITPDYCFARKKGNTKYELNKNPEKLNFSQYEIYAPNITMIDKGDKHYCITELKKINNINEFIYFKQLNKKYLENKNLQELDLFKSDFEKLQNLDELQNFLKDVKYSKKHIVVNRECGWVNTFKGINLCSNDNYKLTDDKSPEVHYHLHNLENFYPKNQKDLLNLFDCVGKEFTCSCYYIKNGKRIKYCKETFKFEKLIYIFKYKIDINQISIKPSDKYAYFFNLEEKYDPKEKKSKKFFIYNK